MSNEPACRNRASYGEIRMDSIKCRLSQHVEIEHHVARSGLTKKSGTRQRTKSIGDPGHGRALSVKEPPYLDTVGKQGSDAFESPTKPPRIDLMTPSRHDRGFRGDPPGKFMVNKTKIRSGSAVQSRRRTSSGVMPMALDTSSTGMPMPMSLLATSLRPSASPAACPSASPAACPSMRPFLS